MINSLRTIRRKLYTNRTLYRKTLVWVNQKRERRGMEPLSVLPPGEPHNALQCPVAKALRKPGTRKMETQVKLTPAVALWCDHTGTGFTWTEATLPLYVQEFVTRFDNLELATPGISYGD